MFGRRNDRETAAEKYPDRESATQRAERKERDASARRRASHRSSGMRDSLADAQDWEDAQRHADIRRNRWRS